MKRLMLFAALTLAATEMNAKVNVLNADSTSHAAATEEAVPAKVTIAPEIGVNFLSMVYKSSTGNDLGTSSKILPRVGFALNMSLGEKFFIQSGLFYYQSGKKLAETGSIIGLDNSFKNNITINNIQLPLSLGYKYDLGNAGSVFVMAGAYAAYQFAGKETSDNYISGVYANTQKSDLKFGSKDGLDNMKRFDYGLNFAAGYQLPMGLYLRLQYGLGLRQLSNNTTTSIKQGAASASIGYFFHSKKKKN
jgi:hypothetical protein